MVTLLFFSHIFESLNGPDDSDNSESFPSSGPFNGGNNSECDSSAFFGKSSTDIIFLDNTSIDSDDDTTDDMDLPMIWICL